MAWAEPAFDREHSPLPETCGTRFRQRNRGDVEALRRKAYAGIGRAKAGRAP